MPKKDTRPEPIRAIVDQRNHYKRALRALTHGQAKLEWAAEVCGRMNWSRPEEAILYARGAVFRGLYAGEPLCEIEQAMAVKRHNSMSVLVAYEVVAPVIQRQLNAAGRARAEVKAGE